ncbi:MAG: type II toxin-antitoxin system VapC family toxin [Pedosphaera sp.]|nr:type II toxin-antitoxin system VapC family toxin [Pedosphaera sp.]
MGDGIELLLDTCVFLWLTQTPGEISRPARRAIDDSGNELWLSHASIWEVHLKHLTGKLTLPEKPRLWFSRQLAVWGVRDRPIDLESLHLTSELPLIHKDPFDRLLVAQARAHELTLVSPDKVFTEYGLKNLW